MKEMEHTLADGSLYYEVYKNHIEITGFQGLAGEVCVPSYIDDFPVTAIGKKAFLSKKNLRKIILPETIERIEDWAFAYCSELAYVGLGAKQHTEEAHCAVSFGRAVFLDCFALREIEIEGRDKQLAVLLAAAVTKLNAYYLLEIPEVGSAEWFAKWDAAMLNILHTPDLEGYAKQVLCGEEDYGSTDQGAFVKEKRKGKVRLAFLRLLCPIGLVESSKAELEAYLQNHTKGCESEEAWEVVLAEYGDERAYYQLFAELGCVHADNLPALLADIGEEKTEMKAYFMRYKEEKLGYEDFFGGLEL